MPESSPSRIEADAREVALIETIVLKVGMKSLLNHGAGSLVYTEGIQGVSQDHILAFAREIAAHCVATLVMPSAKKEGGAR